MTKQIIKKGLFNHYPQTNNDNKLDQEIKKSRIEEKKNSLNQEFKNSRNNKENWKKINIRIREDLSEAIKIQAIKNKMKIEDLYNQILEEYITKKEEKE